MRTLNSAYTCKIRLQFHSLLITELGFRCPIHMPNHERRATSKQQSNRVPNHPRVFAPVHGNSTLQILLKSMLRLVRRLIIYVHIRSLNIWQGLNLNLQFLGNIMRLPQTHLWAHHNIHLSDHAWAAMIASYGIDGDDVWRVGEAGVSEKLMHVDRTTDTDQKEELGESGA